MRVSAAALLCLVLLTVRAPAAVSQTSDWMSDTATVEYKARSRSFFEQGCRGCDTAVVVSPRLLNQAEVRVALERNYPVTLRDAGISGSVLVWMIVDSAGAVERSEVGIPAQNPEFSTAALAVVHRMRFSPARTRTGPTGSFVLIPITFQTVESAITVGGSTPAPGTAAPPPAASRATTPGQGRGDAMNQNPPFLPSMATAIDSGDTATVRALFRTHPEQLHVFTPFAGKTWLHYAARSSTLEMVKLLIEIGFDVNTPDREGTTALNSAAVGGHLAIARHLLDQGGRMDVSSSVRNPLFGAIVGRSPEVVKLLLERGVDSTVRYGGDWKDMDAVAFAMMRGERELARMIALWNAGGDERAAERAMAEGLRVAYRNTRRP